MRKAQHTPGSWKCVERDDTASILVTTEDHLLSVKVSYHASRTNSIHINKANARLIAAAPELLEALERLLLSPHGTHQERKAADASALAALAKAKGE